MISLKSIKGIALVTAIFGASLALSVGTIHADNDSSSSSAFSSSTSAVTNIATGTTTATFDVSAGDGSTPSGPNTDNGALQLTSAPSFNFGSINVATIVGNQSVGSKTVSNSLSVKDYRGASTGTTQPGWNVTAQMTAFKDTATNNAGSDLTATISNLSTKSGKLSKTTIGNSAANIFSSNDNETKGLGTASATFDNTGATLTFANTNAPVSGHSYSSTITWTLSNTASSTTN